MLDPNTEETPDGGAKALPNHPDFAKAAAAAASTASAPTPGPEGAQPAKRKRRTKAEMEAARAAEAATSSATSAPSAAEPAPPSREALPYFETPEYKSEFAAAVAETEGHKILTDDVRTCIESDAVEYYLRNLSLEGAITLVRERMFAGMKTLEVER